MTRSLLQDRLTASAHLHPDRTAIVYQRQRISFAELEASSNRLARALKAAGCRSGDRVALLLPKSIEAVIAMFGALKAGTIYVPLDTTSPATRIGRILEACECRCVLACSATASLLGELARNGALANAAAGWMDDTAAADSVATRFRWPEVSALPPTAVESGGKSSDPAHILFTSGSTGEPKGVVIKHSNILHFVDWATRYFDIRAEDKISGHPPLHFDLSTFDIYGSISAGAELHFVPPELNLLPHRLGSFIRDSQLTQWFSVPSILVHMAKFNAVAHDDFPALRRLLWCGEKFPVPGLIHWMKRLPHVSFFNLYGPTEATIASSCYRVPVCPASDSGEIPIGEPCDGERLLVLDEHLTPVPAGQTGDLYIAGPGLSPGYWRDSQRTSEVFLTSPKASTPFRRIYKTGDLARTNEVGEIFLLGRSDSQIKRRGYRIELGEIEAAVYTHADIQDAAVVAIESDDLDGQTICCAFVPAAGHNVDPADLKKRISGVLPHYMLPARWLPLGHMPRNANGKTDRSKLKQHFRLLADSAGASHRAEAAAPALT